MRKRYPLFRRPALRRSGLFHYPSGYASVEDYVARFCELNHLMR